MPSFNVPQSIVDQAMETVYQVSDDVGETDLEGNGGSYWMRYEGWAAICVEAAATKAEKALKKKGIDPESEDGQVYIEEQCKEYAAEQSDKVIKSWNEETPDDLVMSGHEDSGIYGVTWAIFKR